MKARVERIWCGRASIVSINERSSAAWTIGQVVWVT
jgi:hypothetical protein